MKREVICDGKRVIAVFREKKGKSCKPSRCAFVEIVGVTMNQITGKITHISDDHFVLVETECGDIYRVISHDLLHVGEERTFIVMNPAKCMLIHKHREAWHD